MGYAARRLRARHARRLVARFVMTGYAFILWVVTGWGLGLSASATVATLCIGLPVMALIHRFVAQEHGRHRRDGQIRSGSGTTRA
jgi:hypothetical protein